MTIDDARRAAHELADLAQRHGQPLLVGAGAVGALLALVLLWRFLRRGYVHERLGTVAVTLATLFAMEGMYEVAHGPLGLNIAGSLMFCATFEVVMLHQGSLAAHKLAARADADVSRHMRFVWLVAGASGVIASTASNSLTEVVLRLVTPPLAAGIWYMSLYADKKPAERQPSRWIWTPQRIGVRLGLLKPGTVDDLTEVFRQRAVRRIVDAAVVVWQAERIRLADEPQQLDAATGRRVARAARRLDQLAKTVDADTMAAAQRQLRLTLGIRQQLFAGIGPDGGPVRDLAEPDRLALEQLRTNVRALTADLHCQARTALGVDQPGGHRMVHGVRMPAAIADQIPDQIHQEWLDRFRSNRVVQVPAGDADQPRTTPVDHPVGPDQTAEADQTEQRDMVHARTTPTPVDQPPTSGSVPADRTTPARRTTTRVDRVRPVSPAAGGEIPPRIAAMVRDLRRAYRGDIPGRRAVMERMGWTSAGDTQAAINVVRAERAARTKKEEVNR